MPSDPFSDILKLTNAQSVVSGGLTAGGRWAVRFPAFDKIKFFAVVKGQLWLSLDGRKKPVYMDAGDVFLLASPRAFTLASDLKATPIAAADLFDPKVTAMVQLGKGDDCVQIGGQVKLDPANAEVLTKVLPPLIHVTAGSLQATVLQWLLDQLVRERTTELPGSELVLAQLAQLMFVHILRAYVATAAVSPCMT